MAGRVSPFGRGVQLVTLPAPSGGLCGVLSFQPALTSHASGVSPPRGRLAGDSTSGLSRQASLSEGCEHEKAPTSGLATRERGRRPARLHVVLWCFLPAVSEKCGLVSDVALRVPSKVLCWAGTSRSCWPCSWSAGARADAVCYAAAGKLDRRRSGSRQCKGGRAFPGSKWASLEVCQSRKRVELGCSHCAAAKLPSPHWAAPALHLLFTASEEPLGAAGTYLKLRVRLGICACPREPPTCSPRTLDTAQTRWPACWSSRRDCTLSFCGEASSREGQRFIKLLICVCLGRRGGAVAGLIQYPGRVSSGSGF